LREVYEKHDKFYQRGRACIEKVRGSVELLFVFLFVFAAFLPNLEFCGSIILDDHF
jgi:hypothetical protein